jgi:hypothetical protein
MLNNNPSFINVRFAGDPDCSPDSAVEDGGSTSVS